jgi:hypothetical protein
MILGRVLKVWQVADAPETEVIVVPELGGSRPGTMAGEPGASADSQEEGNSKRQVRPGAVANRPVPSPGSCPVTPPSPHASRRER